VSTNLHFGNLRGVIPPVLTPLTPDGEVDQKSLTRLAGFLLDAGVSGLFACGSSAETALLDDAQRETVIGTLVDAAAGRVPVLAGVIDSGTRRVIEHARRAERLGADAVVSTAPYYNETHPNEILAHFRSLASATALPVVAYDIPSTTHTMLPSTVTAQLAEEKVIVGIKDSSGDMINFRDMVERTRHLEFSVFVGNEMLAEIGLFLGAHGLVPSLGNVDPHGFVSLYDAATAGDWESARAAQTRLSALKRIAEIGDPGRIGIFSALMSGFKTALVHRGVFDHTAVSAPLSALTEEEQEKVIAAVETAGLGRVASA
jgi:4-hydroxy-tetrahydrodipicolinate synthase